MTDTWPEPDLSKKPKQKPGVKDMIKIMWRKTWQKGVDRSRDRIETLLTIQTIQTRLIENLQNRLHTAMTDLAEHKKIMATLAADLEKARRNDTPQDPKTGRFVTAKELDAKK